VKLYSHLIICFIFTTLLTGCFSKDSSPDGAPENVSVVAGESLVVIDWDEIAGRTYWLYYKAGPTAGQNDFDSIIKDIQAPLILTGLDNDQQYAITLTSSNGGSPVGPFSDVVTSTPRLLNPDIAWNIGTPLTSEELHDITFANNLYITVGDAATVFVGAFEYTEDSGVSAWVEPETLPVDAGVNLSTVSFDGTQFVALGEDGTAIRSTDTEATTWELVTAIETPPTMHSLAVGAGLYVAVGDTGAIYTNDSTGITADWTEQTSGTDNDLYRVTFVFDRFIAVGELGTLLTSTDGITWEVQTSGTNNALRASAYGADLYVAVGDAGTIVSSSDAVSWAAQEIPTTESYRGLVFGPDSQFIAVGTTGTLAYSETGLDESWLTSSAGVIDLNSLASNQVFIAVGAAGTNVSGK